MATDTKQRLVMTAHDLFYAEGFHGVGLDRIIREVGVTKTTFYNHFESKDALVLEALRWHDRWWRDHFMATLREIGGESARAQLAAIPDALESVLADEAFNGCIFVNVSVEFPSAHDPAHVAAARHKRAMMEILRELAVYARADDPDALAEELSMLMEGSYVTRHVTGEPRTSSILRRLVGMTLERRLPEEE